MDIVALILRIIILVAGWLLERWFDVKALVTGKRYKYD